MPERRATKPLEWLPSARAAYLETLEKAAYAAFSLSAGR
jgi:hypothetical protein